MQIAQIAPLTEAIPPKHDATHATAAASAVVGVEAITKSFLYFAHERLWEASAFSTRRVNGAHAHHFQSVEA
jgi:uncharacterized membrane protein